jgi:hypothetical protein
VVTLPTNIQQGARKPNPVVSPTFTAGKDPGVPEMKMIQSALLTATLLSAAAVAQAGSYEITVTNNLADELLAPVLVAPVGQDSKIFMGNYVSNEAETQILTGDPGKLAKKIGREATVAHGSDGPPGVLLAPGKSITFTVKTDADSVRLISMVAPTKVPDNFVSSVVNLGAPLSVTLDRYDIGHNEGSKQVSHVGNSAATVTIKSSMM